MSLHSLHSLRIAAVSYWNAMPLVAPLADVEVVQMLPPAEVAAGLAAGTLDVGLVPAIALCRIPDLVPVGSFGIASPGPVDSVLLRLRCPPEAVRTLALDPHSRTSQVLAQLVLRGFFGCELRAFEASPAEAFASRVADAVLVIGDPALALPETLEPDEQRLDLASAWASWTGKPFVFAVWAARADALARHPNLVDVLDRAAERGLLQREAIAEAGAAALGSSRERLSVYLHQRIRYRLGPDERDGLSEFLHRARAFSL